jgi:hypothetical protein
MAQQVPLALPEQWAQPVRWELLVRPALLAQLDPPVPLVP